jgi:hypothetical protein
VSSIIREGEWFWRRARSDRFVHIQSKLFEVSIGGEDLPAWKSSTGTYLSAQTWELLQTKLPEVDGIRLSGLSWQSLNMLSFFGWFLGMPSSPRK